MAWSFVASATLAANAANPGASWNGGNLGATPAIGDRIIAAVDCSFITSQCHVTGVSSTGGGVIEWSRDFIMQANHSGYFEELSVWSGVVEQSTSVTAITFALSPSLSSSSGISCAISTFRGLATGFGLGVDQNGLQDILSGGFASTTSNTTCDSKATLIGTNKASQLVIGVAADSGANTTLSVGSGFTLGVKSDANINGECLLEYKDSGVAGFPQQATVTAGISIFYMMGVLVYRLLAGNTQLSAKRPKPFAPGIAR